MDVYMKDKLKEQKPHIYPLNYKIIQQCHCLRFFNQIHVGVILKRIKLLFYTPKGKVSSKSAFLQDGFLQ